MKNIVRTKGFVNDDGCIEIPGVFLEDGAEVDVTISVESGKFEVAIFRQRKSMRGTNSRNSAVNTITATSVPCRMSVRRILKYKEDFHM